MNSILKKGTAFLLGAVLALQFCLPSVLKAGAVEKQIELSGSVSRAANYTEALKEYPETFGQKEQVFPAARAAEGVKAEADGGVLSSETEVLFNLNVAEAGRYNIRIEYKIAGGAATTDVVRKVKLNGEVPFSEAERIIFSRSFVDEGEITLNTSGDEIRPSVKELRERRTTMLYDSVRFYSEPLQFWFDSGVQTLSLEYVSSDMYIYFGMTTKSSSALFINMSVAKRDAVKNMTGDGKPAIPQTGDDTPDVTAVFITALVSGFVCILLAGCQKYKGRFLR